MYDELVAKVSNTDASGFNWKTKSKCDTDKSDLEKKFSDEDKKIPDTSELVKKQIIMLKLLKYKVSGLTTNSALTAVKNNIPDISNLVKKKQILIKK